MEYWESKADDGLILFSEWYHLNNIIIDLIPPNPVFPGPDRFLRKPVIRTRCLIIALVATIHTRVAPGRANIPLFQYSMAFIYGKAYYL